MRLYQTFPEVIKASHFWSCQYVYLKTNVKIYLPERNFEKFMKDVEYM